MGSVGCLNDVVSTGANGRDLDELINEQDARCEVQHVVPRVVPVKWLGYRSLRDCGQ